MNRALSWTVYLYFGLAVAHWCSLHQMIHSPPGRFMCGNVITDPYHLLMNKLAPIVAVCVAASVRARIQARRRPLLPLLVLPMFFGTTAALLYEAYWLHDWGLSFSVWWFPWL